MSDFLMQASGLVKSYKNRRVVDGVSMSVKPGQIVGLLGPNGAGKTTCFYMIVGLVPPDTGKVEFLDQDISKTPMYQRARLGMGYLSQEPSIFRKLTVKDNILAILETLDISATERKNRLDNLVEELGLTKVLNQKAITLSGGERRRLEIARALVTNPKFIMLDEPFSGVDPIAVYDVQQIIYQLKDKGLGILITDHNVRETLAITDYAYIMVEGKVLREGTPEFLKNDELARTKYLWNTFDEEDSAASAEADTAK
ncbi:MAG: LPS export ABC transporter ATP-binding protein [Lentisphaeraceae bacterium]|nr:LPS export ABC transporter ATP-binding protein [Lentisphaeraceae bacterium]